MASCPAAAPWSSVGAGRPADRLRGRRGPGVKGLSYLSRPDCGDENNPGGGGADWSLASTGEFKNGGIPRQPRSTPAAARLPPPRSPSRRRKHPPTHTTIGRPDTRVAHHERAPPSHWVEPLPIKPSTAARARVCDEGQRLEPSIKRRRTGRKQFRFGSIITLYCILYVVASVDAKF